MYPDDAGEYRWHLKASNGRIVADSGEGYTRESDCFSAIGKFKTKVGSAKLVRHPTPQEKVAKALLLNAHRGTRLG